jgi:hypothetical protein
VNATELIDAVRSVLGDESPPYKWQDSALMRYLNEAEEQICRRAYLLIDETTTSICQFSVSVSVASYRYHSKILQIKRVVTASSTIPLNQYTRAELDAEDTGWISQIGTPTKYVAENIGELILVPIPQSVTTATLQVARLPLNSFSAASTQSPEVDDGYHNDLIDWALHRAYERRDTDTQNMQLSQYYEGRFTVRFGALPTAKSERARKSIPSNMSVKAREFGI